jgi:hypothetical protein
MFVELAVIKFCRASGAGFIDIVDMNDINSGCTPGELLTVDCLRAGGKTQWLSVISGSVITYNINSGART